MHRETLSSSDFAQLGAVAWVGDPQAVEGLDVMHEHHAPLFERHGLPFKVFVEPAPAIAWVRHE